MGLTLFGGEKNIKCDGYRLNGEKCTASYGSCGLISETPEQFLDNALHPDRGGFTLNSKTGKAFCRVCSQVKQQK